MPCSSQPNGEFARAPTRIFVWRKSLRVGVRADETNSYGKSEPLQAARSEPRRRRFPAAQGNRIGRAGAVRLSLESGAEGLAEHGPGPVETHPHRSFNLGNDGPGPPRAVQGRSARCGNTLSDQSARLRLKINLQKQRHLRIPTERKRVHVSSLSPRRHFPVGFSLYDVYGRFRHRMVPRLVFPSNKRFEYSKRFASLLTCYWQHSCSGCDLPPG